MREAAEAAEVCLLFVLGVPHTSPKLTGWFLRRLLIDQSDFNTAISAAGSSSAAGKALQVGKVRSRSRSRRSFASFCYSLSL
jgi:hypothetical protein